MDSFKIINATQLDQDLKNLANAFRTKIGELEDNTYSFPESYLQALDQLQFGETKTTDDILLQTNPDGEGFILTMPAGFYDAASVIINLPEEDTEEEESEE